MSHKTSRKSPSKKYLPSQLVSSKKAVSASKYSPLKYVTSSKKQSPSVQPSVEKVTSDIFHVKNTSELKDVLNEIPTKSSPIAEKAKEVYVRTTSSPKTSKQEIRIKEILEEPNLTMEEKLDNIYKLVGKKPSQTERNWFYRMYDIAKNKFSNKSQFISSMLPYIAGLLVLGGIGWIAVYYAQPFLSLWAQVKPKYLRVAFFPANIEYYRTELAPDVISLLRYGLLLNGIELVDPDPIADIALIFTSLGPTDRWFDILNSIIFPTYKRVYEMNYKKIFVSAYGVYNSDKIEHGFSCVSPFHPFNLGTTAFTPSINPKLYGAFYLIPILDVHEISFKGRFDKIYDLVPGDPKRCNKTQEQIRFLAQDIHKTELEINQPGYIPAPNKLIHDS